MAEKRLNVANVRAVICAAILVGTEIIAAALALGWAMGGLMGWGQEVTTGLILLCLGLGVYIIYRFIKGAARAEPFYH